MLKIAFEAYLINTRENVARQTSSGKMYHHHHHPPMRLILSAAVKVKH